MSALAIFQYMHKHGLTLEDVGTVGWEPRFKDQPKSLAAEKCRRVTRCWERMAALGLKFVDLEQFASRPANRERFQKELQNQALSKPTVKPKMPAKSSTSKTPPVYCAAEPSKPVPEPGSDPEFAIARDLGAVA